MSDDVLDFSTKRSQAAREDVIRRLVAALPPLLNLPPEQLATLVGALSEELKSTMEELMGGGSLDLITPREPARLKEALEQSIPKNYGTHEYFALYATGITLTRLMGTLIEMGREAGRG